MDVLRLARFSSPAGASSFSIGMIIGISQNSILTLSTSWRSEPLSANISETLTLPEFSVEGGEGIDDGND